MQIRRIIIEGADQQGKTTLANRLNSELNWDIVHFPPPSPDFNFFGDYITKPYTISDRNFISELVYAQVKGQMHRINYLFELCETMMHDTMVIFLDRGNEFEFESRKEEYTQEQIQKSRDIYHIEISFLEQNTGFKILRLNPHDEEVYNLLIDYVISTVKYDESIGIEVSQ